MINIQIICWFNSLKSSLKPIDGWFFPNFYQRMWCIDLLKKKILSVNPRIDIFPDAFEYWKGHFICESRSFHFPLHLWLCIFFYLLYSINYVRATCNLLSSHDVTVRKFRLRFHSMCVRIGSNCNQIKCCFSVTFPNELISFLWIFKRHTEFILQYATCVTIF